MVGGRPPDPTVAVRSVLCHGDEMAEPLDLYLTTRDRILALARSAGPDAMTNSVPACPEWTAHHLVAHLVSLPAAIGAGDLPTGDVDGWIEAILRVRADRSIDQLAEEWFSVDDTITSMITGGGAMLCDDIVIHESDLRGALGMFDRELVDPDLSVRRALDSCRAALEARELGAIAVVHGDDHWVSHDANAGWTIEATPWEAVRALSSRRTAHELREIGSSDRIDDYIALLDEHLPLPATSLGEW
jgi:uncharacterized protein (TIGR03083 family)